VRNKIGDQILSTLCSGRTLFGHAIKTVHDIFHAADTDGSNSLDKEEFRDVCDRLDLGIPTAQMQELWAAFVRCAFFDRNLHSIMS
jgi:Ca2+-binding EF-hand superfamily protein